MLRAFSFSELDINEIIPELVRYKQNSQFRTSRFNYISLFSIKQFPVTRVLEISKHLRVSPHSFTIPRSPGSDKEQQFERQSLVRISLLL